MSRRSAVTRGLTISLISISLEEQQAERVANIELADPMMNQLFRYWFWDKKDALPPESSRPNLERGRIWGTLMQGKVALDSSVDSDPRIRLAAECAANLVKEDLIKLAQYVMLLERENRLLRGVYDSDP